MRPDTASTTRFHSGVIIVPQRGSVEYAVNDGSPARLDGRTTRRLSEIKLAHADDEVRQEAREKVILRITFSLS
jgi:hypothetical protein